MTPQKLKNAILQLAIQGKLVEQRPEDGVARVPATRQHGERETRRHHDRSWSKSWPKSWPQSWPQSLENKILSLLFFGDMSRKQLSDKLQIVLKANSLRGALSRLVQSQFVAYTIPEKTNSRLQKYHLTDEGRNHVLRQNAGNVP